jgi:hypothetical protein
MHYINPQLALGHSGSSQQIKTPVTSTAPCHAFKHHNEKGFSCWDSACLCAIKLIDHQFQIRLDSSSRLLLLYEIAISIAYVANGHHCPQSM